MEQDSDEHSSRIKANKNDSIQVQAMKPTKSYCIYFYINSHTAI